MEEKNSYPISQINTIALRRGNINIDVQLRTSNICYVGQSLIKVFKTFLSFAKPNASFQLC